MSRLFKARVVGFILIVCLGIAGCAAQAQAQTQAQAQPGGAKTGAQSKSKRSMETLKKYAGRYELERGIIPVSTLDVTLESGELYVKPSLAKKRRLVHKSKSVFTDEIEGARYSFNRDDDGKVISLTFVFEGESYTAGRVELPPPSLKGNTTFKLNGYAEASIVVLSGSFNNWNQSQIVCGREAGEWVCRLDLDPGFYTYKFIVDGNWMLDPANPETSEDEAGNVNSVVEVKQS